MNLLALYARKRQKANSP